MSSLNYGTFVSQLANMMPIGSTDAGFITFLPGCIDYSEQRIYRELDIFAQRVTDATASFSSGNRNFTLPTGLGTFLVVETINVITPAATASSAGTRNPLVFTSREFIDTVYPSNTLISDVPAYVGMTSNSAVVVGPAPDAAYVAEVIGVQRPVALSSGNSSTFLTQVLPDLFFTAAMVYASGFMKDFGSQSDNPGMAQSWETQYQLLKKSADEEALRQRYQSEGWTAKSPSELATPPRV